MFSFAFVFIPTNNLPEELKVSFFSAGGRWTYSKLICLFELSSFFQITYMENENEMLIGRYDFQNVFKRKDTATAERTRLLLLESTQ